jgi:hypothetical protein
MNIIESILQQMPGIRQPQKIRRIPGQRNLAKNRSLKAQSLTLQELMTMHNI